MYIEKTNADERLVIETALDGIFPTIDRAHCILMDVLEEYFFDREQKPIDKYDAERAGLYLHSAADMIFDAMLQYYLTVGDEEWRGVRPHLEGAERALQAIKVNQAISNCWDAEKRIGRNSEKAIAMSAQCRAAYSLPDELALPVINGIIK